MSLAAVSIYFFQFSFPSVISSAVILAISETSCSFPAIAILLPKKPAETYPCGLSSVKLSSSRIF